MLPDVAVTVKGKTKTYFRRFAVAEVEVTHDAAPMYITVVSVHVRHDTMTRGPGQSRNSRNIAQAEEAIARAALGYNTLPTADEVDRVDSSTPLPALPLLAIGDFNGYLRTNRGNVSDRVIDVKDESLSTGHSREGQPPNGASAPTAALTPVRILKTAPLK